MNLSLKIGSREFSLGLGKSLSPTTQAFVNGTDIDDAGRGALMVTPYAQSAWVYCAVSILAQSVAQIPFRISRVSGGKAKKVRSLRTSADPSHRKLCRRALGEDILESGDVVDLFNRPHPTMDRQMFFEMLVTWLSLRGEFFVLPLDLADQPVDLSERTPRVKRLLTLPPEMFWHVVQGFDLTAWRYTGAPLQSPLPSEMLLPTEVVHSKLPNPYLYWRGLSPVTVALAPAQTDFAGEQFQKGLWLNNADTGVIVTTEQQATPEQQAQILSALRQRKRKAGTPDAPLFLFGGAKIEKPTLSMMDMQYLETRKFLRQEIFAILKVPETMAGFTSDLNDGGAGGSLDAQKASFIESTVGSLCGRLEDAFARIVATFGDDLVGWFDIDSLPIMQAARRARWDTGTKMFAMGVPINDVNTNLDLGLPEYVWGNKSFLPFNLQEVGAPTDAPAEDEADPAPDADDAEKSNPIARLGKFLARLKAAEVQQRKPDTTVLWNAHVQSRRKTVKVMQSKVGKVLTEFRGKALAKLNEVHLEKTAGNQWQFKVGAEIQQRSLVDIIFHHLVFGQALESEMKTPIQATLNLAGSELMAELGDNDPWEYPPQAAKDYLARRSQPIQGTGETVRAQLNTALQAGLDEGETTAELSARVRGVFNNLTDGEAKRIALTETNMAYNDARHLAMTKAGIEYKAWLSSHGPNVREAHALAEEQYIDAPIAVDEPFEVGGEQLMFPGDDSLGASASNVINCQCVSLAAQKTDEDEKSLTFKIHGLGLVKFLKK